MFLSSKRTSLYKMYRTKKYMCDFPDGNEISLSFDNGWHKFTMQNEKGECVDSMRFDDLKTAVDYYIKANDDIYWKIASEIETDAYNKKWE